MDTFIRSSNISEVIIEKEQKDIYPGTSNYWDDFSLVKKGVKKDTQYVRDKAEKIRT